MSGTFALAVLFGLMLVGNLLLLRRVEKLEDVVRGLLTKKEP